MTLRLDDLADTLRLSLKDPRRGMRQLLELRPATATCLQALVLMAVASALLLHVGVWIAPPPQGNPLIDLLLDSPFTTALAQGAVLWGTAIAIHFLGRAWGGQGDYGGALLAVAWLQAIFVIVQAIQLVAMVLLPPLASLLSLLSLFLFFWLLSHFVAELHGFVSVGKTFLAILVAMVAISFLVTFLLAMLLGPGAFSDA